MKLAFSTLVCPQWTLEEIFHCAREQGIEGIDFRGVGDEIDITRMSAFTDDLPKTLRQLKEHHLQLPCFNTSITLVSPAPDRWQMMLDECHRYAALAEKTHTPFLRVFGGCLPKGMTRSEGLALAQRHLKQAAKVASQFGCRVLLETHDDWSTAEHILELLEPFDPQSVGVLWDIDHSFRHGEPPAQTASALRDWIAHTHIKDSIMHGATRLPTLLGRGELPLGDYISQLDAIGYTGWTCLETEKRWNEEAPDPQQSIPDFVRFMRRP